MVLFGVFGVVERGGEGEYTLSSTTRGGARCERASRMVVV